MEEALNVPIAADALQEFVAARLIRLESANVDDAFDAGFSLVLAPQYGGLTGDFHHLRGLWVAAESEHAAGKVGEVWSRQDEVSGVVGDEREAAALQLSKATQRPSTLAT